MRIAMLYTVAAVLLLSAAPAAAGALKSDALVIADGLKGPVADMSQAVWTYSAIGLRETKSSAYLADVRGLHAGHPHGPEAAGSLTQL